MTEQGSRRMASIWDDFRRRLLDAQTPQGLGDLAKELDYRTIQTPALDLIDAELMKLANTAGGRLIISVPPQEGKSSRAARVFPVWCLKRSHDMRIVIASYGQDLARKHGKFIRNSIRANPQLGIRVQSGSASVSDWSIEGAKGGVLSVGVGTGLTGNPADLLVIDDPMKDRKEADSPVFRDDVWDWWTDTASTRLGPGAPVCLILCMTGDTPVLRPDGSETPLRDIRPGDEVATFTDNGEVTTSIVSNWTSQGFDDTFAVHLASGRTVRANARHPFWIIGDDGSGSWRRLESLRVGMRVRCLTAPTEESSALPMGATSQRDARGCACPTVGRLDGPMGTGPHPRHMRAGERFDSRVDTESRPRTMVGYSLSRASVARSAEDTSAKSLSLRTGLRSSVSITAMTPALCEDCSATTATSSLLAATRLTSFGGPLSTSIVSTDEIVSIAPSGREEVFDIEVLGTHRFIANGLDVSNTRWHEDDLAGRLLSGEDKHRWRVVNIPAQAIDENDPLGREPGEYLISARGRTKREWEDIKKRVGSRTWASLYQGQPAPPEGAILKRDTFKFYNNKLWITRQDGAHIVPDYDEILMSCDLAFKDLDSSDYVVLQIWMRRGANCFLLDQDRGRYSFTETCNRIRLFAAKWPQALLKLVEDKANGPAVIASLNQIIPGIVPEIPNGSKIARVNAVSPLFEAGNVWIPAPEIYPWVSDYIDELSSFPSAANDDQTDATSQALNRLILVPLLHEGILAEEEAEEEREYSISPY